MNSNIHINVMSLSKSESSSIKLKTFIISHICLIIIGYTEHEKADRISVSGIYEKVNQVMLSNVKKKILLIPQHSYLLFSWMWTPGSISFCFDPKKCFCTRLFSHITKPCLWTPLYRLKCSSLFQNLSFVLYWALTWHQKLQMSLILWAVSNSSKWAELKYEKAMSVPLLARTWFVFIFMSFSLGIMQPFCLR